jgi:carboxyl-terminal processing protease
VQKKPNRIVFLISVGILSLSIGVGAGYGVGVITHALSEDEQRLVDEYRLLKEDWLYGNETEYLGQLAASGLVNKVAESQNDPFTFYTENFAKQGLATDGNGFGFSSRYYDGGLYVTSVCRESKAHDSGLKTGDVLYDVKVGNEVRFDFKSHTLVEINNKLSSVNDTTTIFTFTGKRDGETKTFVMTRGSYQENLVDILQTPNAGNDFTMALRVNTFLGTPASAVEGSIKSYASIIQHLVIDLRGNGGGYVSQAAEMLRLFVKKGTLLYQLRDKNNAIISQEYQDSNPKYEIEKFSLIMDNNTASASEIFTLAMRAGCNTTTYGMKSYGKGIAQNFKTFSDGSVVRYTNAYVYGPERENETMYEEGNDADSIMCIHAKGIMPDVFYTTDYSFLSSAIDYSSIGVSEYGQNHFLRVLNDLYPGVYPTKYSATYHFTSAIMEYSQAMAEKYLMPSLAIGFNDEGGMYKPLNDILNKETFDQYLHYYNDLMTFVLGA